MYVLPRQALPATPSPKGNFSHSFPSFKRGGTKGDGVLSSFKMTCLGTGVFLFIKREISFKYWYRVKKALFVFGGMSTLLVNYFLHLCLEYELFFDSNF